MKKDAAPATMKPRCLLLGLLLLTIHAYGQADSSALDGTLVRCGAERVAVLADTASKDGHFAAGWTIRPKGKQAPVDWSAYRRDDPLPFLKRYGLNDNPSEDGDDPDKSSYRLVDGVLDLRAKTFTAFAFASPYFPDKYRSELTAAWSEDRHGTRYGVVANSVGSNHTDNNVDLQLVEVGLGGVHFTDLKPAADQAVRSFMQRRDPKDYKRYAWHYDFEAIGQHSEATLTPFKGDTLTINFDAEVFLESNNQDAGLVSFALPKGIVTGTTAEKKPRP